MDESLILSTIGKFYLEVTRLQQIAETQQRRIVELETQLAASQSNATKKKE